MSMDIYELTIDGEVFVSMGDQLGEVYHINTIVLEPNLYGKTLFLRQKFFHKFTENGPQKLEREEMVNILKEHKEN